MAEGKGNLFTWTSTAGDYTLPDMGLQDLIEERSEECDKFADVIIVVGVERRRVFSTRHTLSLHSEYFKCLFDSDQRGMRLPRDPAGKLLVKLPQLDGKVVVRLVTGLNSGWVYVQDDLAKLTSLFEAVGYLQLRAGDNILLAACRNLSSEKLQESYAALAKFLCDVIFVAERFSCAVVVSYVWHLVSQHVSLWYAEEARWPSALQATGLEELEIRPLKCKLLVEPLGMCECEHL